MATEGEQLIPQDFMQGPGQRAPQGKTPREMELEEEVSRLRQLVGEKFRTPLDVYRESLKSINVDSDEAAEILDAIMFDKNGYVEPFVIKGAKRELHGALRTRQAADGDRLLQEMVRHHPMAPAMKDQLTAQYNLADSIHRFGDSSFVHESEEDHEKNLEWVRSLTGPIYEILTRVLADFDYKITVICQKAAVENFWKPRGEQHAQPSTPAE